MESFIQGYYRLASIADQIEPYLVLIIRLYWGSLLFLAGQVQWTDMDPLIATISDAGMPLPTLGAYLLILVEIIGGLSMALGFACRLAAIPLIFAMVLALLTVHWPQTQLIFINPNVFVTEAPVTYLLVTLFMLAFGPGYYSVDMYLDNRYNGTHL